MAYYLYNRTHENGRYHFAFQGKTHLFGCNSGVVAKALKDQIPEGQQPPWRWRVCIPDTLRQQNSRGNVFVIDVMPNNNEHSYCELLDVWGCSYKEGYSSALLRLRSLLTGQQDDDFDRNDFIIDHEGENEPIFTFVYFNGSIENGQLSGTFTAPGPAATNSVLLWPVDFDYFLPIIQHHTTAYRLGGERLLG